jgi:hypothetical protein
VVPRDGSIAVCREIVPDLSCVRSRRPENRYVPGLPVAPTVGRVGHRYGFLLEDSSIPLTRKTLGI